MMQLDRDALIREIERRSPWYQRIEFPNYGVSTTDRPGWAMLDAAWDNKTPDISIEQAAQYRPTPKYALMKPFLPDVAGLTVLEVGSNCGFFSFEFAKMGAASVVGLDVSEKWLDNAEFCRRILGFHNVQFLNCDFMLFDGSGSVPGLLGHRQASIPLVDNRYDVIFTSTVVDHLFFRCSLSTRCCEWLGGT